MVGCSLRPNQVDIGMPTPRLPGNVIAARGRQQGCLPHPMASPTAKSRDPVADVVRCTGGCMLSGAPVPAGTMSRPTGSYPTLYIRIVRGGAPEHTEPASRYLCQLADGLRLRLNCPPRPRGAEMRCQGPLESDCDAPTVKRHVGYGCTGHPLSIWPPAKPRRSRRQLGRHRHISES